MRLCTRQCNSTLTRGALAISGARKHGPHLLRRGGPHMKGVWGTAAAAAAADKHLHCPVPGVPNVVGRARVQHAEFLALRSTSTSRRQCCPWCVLSSTKTVELAQS
eukprot:6159875-Amphidinium_carterae.2